MRDRILDELANEGILLEPDAAELVLSTDDPLGFTRSVLASMPQHPLVLTVEHIHGFRPRPSIPAPVVPTALQS